MAPAKRYASKHAKATQRHRLGTQERHERQPRQAQHDIEALRHALDDLGVPDNLVIAIAGRLRAQKKWLGKLCGLMFPTLFGCLNAYELSRTRGWDKHVPARLLGALPKRSWLQRLRTRGQDILAPRWRHIASMRAATRSRWQGTWGLDDAVFRT
jgi:hypothetical protein